MYQLFDGFPVDEVDPGTNLLVAGPPMTGKYQLLLSLLAGREPVVVVSTDHSVEEIRGDLAKRAPGLDPDDVGVVDCVSEHRNVDTDAPAARIRYVSSPDNLTDIGVHFTDLLDEFPEGRGRTGLYSVSQLLMYSDLKPVYRFLQVFTGRTTAADWLGIHVVNESMHDEQALHTLYGLFDGVVETREKEGDREFRVRGLLPSPTEWVRA